MSSYVPPPISSYHWSGVGTCNHHGVNIFLPSLKSKNSDHGTFSSLLTLLPWLKEIGFSVIQLLPLNDTGTDVSPYNVVSVHALNPLFISSDHVVSFEEFDHFVEENSYWLKAYALFKALKNKNDKKAFWTWPKEEQSYSERLFDKHKSACESHIKTQFVAHQELKDVKTRAAHEGILLMGDLPILVSPDSVEVWQHPELFNSFFDVGAPPDMYDQEGQHWGFPLHRFDKMEASGFQWWKERLKTAEAYYHIYRIDHVVGLFRLWAIPKGQKAKEGFFIPADQTTWLHQGSVFLQELLEGSSLLPIAEDLGVIPNEVRALLKEYGIPGTKVMRWERYWDKGGGVIPPKEYPICSLTTVSTHDSETLGAWWEKENKRPLDDKTRFSLLKESHQSGSLFHINLLGEYLALFKDLVYNQNDQERINIPGQINTTNWRYRTKPLLEEIISHQGLKSAMKNLLC